MNFIYIIAVCVILVIKFVSNSNKSDNEKVSDIDKTIFNKSISVGSIKQIKKHKPVVSSRISDDIEGDWLANERRRENISSSVYSDAQKIKKEHKDSCDAERLKKEHIYSEHHYRY